MVFMTDGRHLDVYIVVYMLRSKAERGHFKVYTVLQPLGIQTVGVVVCTPSPFDTFTRRR